MRKFDLKSIIFIFLLAFQLACGQTQSVSNNGNQNQNSAENSDTNNSVNSNNENTSNIAEDKKKEIDYFAHFKPEHKEVLQKWLKTKSFLRPGVEEIDNSMFDEKFKENYEGNMKFLRETVGENGYQYYVKGDLNKNGKEDFAVLLVDNRKKDGDNDWFSLAIFNSPFKKDNTPNYYEENLHGITNSYIVFSDQFSEKSGKHLFLGKFESDYYCATYFPKGKTYRFEDCL